MSDFVSVFAVCCLEWILVCVLPFYIMWRWWPTVFAAFKIQKKERQAPQLKIEITYSLLTIPIRALFFWFVVYKSGTLRPAFELTKDVPAFFFYYLIYDPYFYWTHRLLHWGWLYRNIHVVHHRSVNPTPFASFSFHPVESILGLLYMLPFVYIFNPSLLLFVLLMILTDIGNLAGHTGFEFLPRPTVSSWWGKWITTPTHHNMHHQFSRYNFGLYWSGWDKYFGTHHPRTEEEFLRVKSGL